MSFHKDEDNLVQFLFLNLNSVQIRIIKIHILKNDLKEYCLKRHKISHKLIKNKNQINR